MCSQDIIKKKIMIFLDENFNEIEFVWDEKGGVTTYPVIEYPLQTR